MNEVSSNYVQDYLNSTVIRFTTIEISKIVINSKRNNHPAQRLYVRNNDGMPKETARASASSYVPYMAYFFVHSRAVSLYFSLSHL